MGVSEVLSFPIFSAAIEATTPQYKAHKEPHASISHQPKQRGDSLIVNMKLVLNMSSLNRNTGPISKSLKT